MDRFTNMEDQVILVDEKDMAIGRMEKMLAHTESALHRAFSVFLFNSEGEMLIHQRAKEKYHSGGLWTNACCSHPRPGESTEDAAHRRMQEELGIDCEIEEVYSFVYRAELDQGLTEHEFDHVFFGTFNGNLNPNTEEIMAWKYISIPQLNSSIQNQPESYTEWFKIALNGLKEKGIKLEPK